MSWIEVFRVFGKLGLTSFGGPVAHIGYFRQAFVVERSWLSEAEFASRLALCQVLPGPASSQLGFLIGWHRAGWLGALAAWLAFTLPSALVLVLLALYGLPWASEGTFSMLHGLKLVAVVIVAHAVWGMWSAMCRTTGMRLLALGGFAMAMWLTGWVGQIGAIALGALIGGLLLKQNTFSITASNSDSRDINRALGAVLLAITASLLLVLPWLTESQPIWQLFDVFYRAGAFVFGGGHVVLPLLQSAVVDTGRVANDTFLVGYGLAQAVPGPLFTFAAWLGALDPASPGWLGALVALVAIFLPGLLLVAGLMPWWQYWQNNQRALWVLSGINAAVVGVLASAWIDPIVSTSVRGWTDVVIVVVCSAWLMFGKVGPGKIVLLALVLAASAYWLGLSV